MKAALRPSPDTAASRPNPIGEPRWSERLRPFLPVILAAAGLAVYWNSLQGVFIFDDEPHIVDSAKIRRLWPPWHLLSTRRPVLYVSLAINYAFGGLDPWGYHLVNVAIHVLAGLTLFGLLRRTLTSDALRVRLAHVADPLAFVVALLWIVHPLNTQSVTYVVQRSESMMGLFYLLTLYCVVRGHASSRPRWWHAGAVIACVAGMGSKAVMVTAPVVALLYDRTFWAGSFRAALRKRWDLYLGLGAIWSVLFLLGIVQTVFDPTPASRHVGFSFKGISPLSYLMTQPGVLLHYLRLSVWPTSLCLDYIWPPVDPSEGVRSIRFWGAALAVLFALSMTLWGVWRNRAAGFVGACFFVILAPTSSFIPIKDPAFEHRMYLPLISVIVLAVVAGYQGAKRLGISPSIRSALVTALTLGCAAPLAYATIERNRLYHSTLAMWSDVREKQPNNHRAHLGVGTALYKAGRHEEALEAFRKALDLRYAYSDGHYNVGVALAGLGRHEEAVRAYREALRLNPKRTEYSVALARALIELNRTAEAADVLAHAARLDPSRAYLLDELAQHLFDQGDYASAEAALRRITQVNPRRRAPHINLGHALRRQGKLDQAAAAYRQALEIDPAYAEAYLHLANTLGQRGRMDAAISALQQALQMDPDLTEAHYSLGWAYKAQGRIEDARAAFERTLALDPQHPEARRMLETLAAEVRPGAKP